MQTSTPRNAKLFANPVIMATPCIFNVLMHRTPSDSRSRSAPRRRPRSPTRSRSPARHRCGTGACSPFPHLYRLLSLRGQGRAVGVRVVQAVGCTPLDRCPLPKSCVSKELELYLLYCLVF